MDSTHQTYTNLAPIDDTDFKVADGDPDPRGWDVISSDGREIGEIDDLIIDLDAMKVRYLVCDLDEDELGLEADRERHVLIPAGRARLDPDDKKLVLDGVTAREIASAPAFTGTVSDRHESFGSSAVAGERPVVRDELVVKTRPTTETEILEEDVLKERFDVEGGTTDGDRSTMG